MAPLRIRLPLRRGYDQESEHCFAFMLYFHALHCWEQCRYALATLSQRKAAQGSRRNILSSMSNGCFLLDLFPVIHTLPSRFVLDLDLGLKAGKRLWTDRQTQEALAESGSQNDLLLWTLHAWPDLLGLGPDSAELVRDACSALSHHSPSVIASATASSTTCPLCRQHAILW